MSPGLPLCIDSRLYVRQCLLKSRTQAVCVIHIMFSAKSLSFRSKPVRVFVLSKVYAEESIYQYCRAQPSWRPDAKCQIQSLSSFRFRFIICIPVACVCVSLFSSIAEDCTFCFDLVVARGGASMRQVSRSLYLSIRPL